jgi:pimeloyl-ACP methyl ester carboxylesterase
MLPRMPTTLAPFRIDIPEAELDDLRFRLERTRWPVPLEEEPNWVRGTEQGWLEEICGYWRDGYDWRSAEARLNGYEQGMAEVRGERMHFLHVRSKHPQAQPLVIVQAWVDHDGDLYSVLSRDQLLTNLMLYWLPNAVSSSARLYYESKKAAQHATDPWDEVVRVPTGYAIYPEELMITPRAWAEQRYPLVHWQEQPRGGHFADFEQPELFAADLWRFGRTIRELEERR